jgi:hypothetical protein
MNPNLNQNPVPHQEAAERIRNQAHLIEVQLDAAHSLNLYLGGRVQYDKCVILSPGGELIISLKPDTVINLLIGSAKALALLASEADRERVRDRLISILEGAEPFQSAAACEPVRSDAPAPEGQDAAERSTPHAEGGMP